MALTRKHKLVMIILALTLFFGITLYERIKLTRNVFVLSEAPSETDPSGTFPAYETLLNQDHPSDADSQKDAEQRIMVHVEGQVAFPGVYELAAGTRVIDAVELAGGLTPEADRRINLAQKLQDEAFVYVPAAGEVVAEGIVNQPRISFSSGDATAEQALVNINTADKARLETLPGIGPVLAERILDHRQQHGPFRQLQDLKKVTGIGDKRYEDIASHITL